MISPVPRKAWGAGTPSSGLCPGPPSLHPTVLMAQKKPQKARQYPGWGTALWGIWVCSCTLPFPMGKRVQVREADNPVQLGLVAGSR